MKKLLIVMEENCLRSALEKQLAHSFQVFVCDDAHSGAEGLRERPDALILDLFLPGMDGITFLNQNREKLPPVILALSSFISSFVLQKLAELGVSAVIQIPCTVSCVADRLKAHI